MFRKSPRAKWLIGIAAIVVLIMSVMAATDAHHSVNVDPSSREAMISVLGSPNPSRSLAKKRKHLIDSSAAGTPTSAFLKPMAPSAIKRASCISVG